MQDTLGSFIRAHRERTTPASVGLPAGGRRRTPGLRREELAQLCDVSPTWLTWLEQGRPVSASGKLLARMAEVLQLSAAERGYLFGLAERLDPQHDDAPDDGGEALDAIVAAIDAPAYVLDRQWDAVAWNAHAAALFGGWLDVEVAAPARPNLLRFMFRAPAARGLIVDWDERARRLVAEFRADIGKHAGDAALSALIAELSQDSPAFDALWRQQDVVSREGGQRRFHHPRAGELLFNQVTLHLAQRHDLKLVMLLPA
ncbi:transcriptional regulator with XRE-family HTH domain [Duganella sp. 1224]|uniref:helix-turn-helix transcriptional regulator n=1 Tax=Duganella sp. 1224 TaxID=2587052 RepID=UPI0015CC5035|nr:helix-turn-helix transcriptional regulator [Duganella sp. 1224]NYE63655.1 transcriptional regulator with XRE-family HTH domain [Duganella sp. 1224]